MEKPQPESTQSQSQDSSGQMITLENEAKTGEDLDQRNYLAGWRLHGLTVGLVLAIFLVNFEVSIVSTALVSVTSDLHDFSRSSWVVTAYLLTYTGLLIIWARFSDLYGRKGLLVLALVLYICFSAACGASQTMVQLIVCRAFQGVGGSGMYALSTVALYEMVPPRKIPQYSMISLSAVIISLSTGPLVGGAITMHSTWRWVFLLNVPAGCIVLPLLVLTMPQGFPNQGLDIRKPVQTLQRIDIWGAFLMAVSSTLLVTSLELASNFTPWVSATVLAPLIISGLGWLAFVFWEKHCTPKGGLVEPVLPFRLLRSRPMAGMLLNSILTGAVTMICIVQIPLRAQTAEGATPLQAGVHLLPFSTLSPVGSILVAICCKNRRVPPLYFLFVSALFQIVGLAFLSEADTAGPNHPYQYGFQAIVGLGAGMGPGVTLLLPPYVVEKRDLAVAVASVTQFRLLGSTIGVAIAVAVGNSWLQTVLLPLLGEARFDAIFRSAAIIEGFSGELQESIRIAFAKCFNHQMKIALGLAVSEILSAAWMLMKEPIRVD